MDKEMLQIYTVRALRKRNFLSSASRWLNLNDIVLSEMKQSQKEKYFSIFFICGI
jgi:hypothetical protein